MYRISAIILISFLLLSLGHSQQKVTFYTADSLKVSADLYLQDYSHPFIILLHQADGSRGEYVDIAPRFLKLGYNCLAVDLRVGSKMNYISNETALLAKEKNIQRTLYDADKDITAALNFVTRYNKKDVILMGSSFSASLCMIRVAGNQSVKAVIACSPGEYFRPGLIVKDQLKGIEAPIFVTATQTELEFVKQLVSDVPEQVLHIYSPKRGIEGEHGAKILWESSEDSDACWFELLLFFKKIRYE